MSDFGPRGEYGRIQRRPYRQGGFDREQRLQTTVAVGAVVLLFVGVWVGFSIGRATAPKPKATPAPVIQTETTLPAETTSTLDASDTTDTLGSSSTDETTASAETTTDVTRPPRPKQLAPANGAVLSASHIHLRWTKVTDNSGKRVTYAFEIQNRRFGTTYGSTQIIKGLKTNAFLARVLSVRRRWRVWAVDAAGNKSRLSPWRTYIHRYVAPRSNNTSSTATSGTAN